jgi:hypothetical protein
LGEEKQSERNKIQQAKRRYRNRRKRTIRGNGGTRGKKRW